MTSYLSVSYSKTSQRITSKVMIQMSTNWHTLSLWFSCIKTTVWQNINRYNLFIFWQDFRVLIYEALYMLHPFLTNSFPSLIKRCSQMFTVNCWIGNKEYFYNLHITHPLWGLLSYYDYRILLAFILLVFCVRLLHIIKITWHQIKRDFLKFCLIKFVLQECH